jgi:NADPH:quinone reductase-like Zn-dependent oxidoreductase
VTKVKKGDRVLGHCISLGTGVSAQAGFQNFTVLNEITVSPIPDSLSYEEAAVVPLGLSTAAAALYQKGYLNLPYPKPGSKELTDSSILIWGASGSVGVNAVQLAVASGVQVVATCSKRNFDYVKALGATHVIDYNDDSVVDQIVEALQGTKFAGAFDTIAQGQTWKSCGAVVEKLGGGLLAGTGQIPEGVNLGKGVNAKFGRFSHQNEIWYDSR